MTIDFSPEDEQRAIRDNARAFIRNDVTPRVKEVLRREGAHRPGLTRAR